MTETSQPRGRGQKSGRSPLGRGSSAGLIVCFAFKPQESEDGMSITLYAQPYDITATGFYFSAVEEFDGKAAKLVNDFGEQVEEFEIQFIDGDQIDCELAKAIDLNQANFKDYLTCAQNWEYWEKTNVIIAVGECGYEFDPQASPDRYWIDVYHVGSMRELAEQFVEDGLYGDIPESLQYYIDYDAIARDLAIDYSAVSVAGEYLIYRAS
ncbi:MAG: antirestriction protein ArdA [Albidovulum sp.]|uniref:antirestriction protein ArdA n=1 Tax=Albidovulum sp. TaxID=1872424 RepID=UPI003CB745FF